MASLTVACFRAQALPGVTKRVLATQNSDACVSMSTASHSKSETRSRSAMKDVTGDASRVPTLTAMKRGQGFRSSFSGRVTTLFGCSGILGHVICSRLGKTGTQMIFPYKRCHHEVVGLKVAGDLGQVLFHEFYLKDEESVRAAMKYSDTVINLIGREYETRNFTFDDVHNKGARLLARCAREEGIKNFIHISHIGAAEEPKTIWSRKGSRFLKSKWDGENAVREEFPDATIFRPVEMVGHDCWFLRYYCNFRRNGFGNSVPLWRRGNYIVKRPLTYKNMGDAIMAALDNPVAMGRTYEAMGPDCYLLSDMMDWMHEVMDKCCDEWDYKRTDLRFSPVPFLKAYASEKLILGQKRNGGHSIEKLERTQLSDESRGLPNITELGVKLENFTDIMPYYLDWYKPFNATMISTLLKKPPIPPLFPLTRLEEANIMAEAEQGNKAVMKLLGF